MVLYLFLKWSLKFSKFFTKFESNLVSVIRTSLDRLDKMIQGHLRSNHYDFEMISDSKFSNFSLFEFSNTFFLDHLGKRMIMKSEYK